jgi:cell division protein ZapE
MSPLEHYRQALESPGFTHDPLQERVMHHFQRVYDELTAPGPSGGRLNRWLDRRRQRRRAAPMGLYLWGGVGRGKTHLMDLFFDALPFDDKLRLHFYSFMRRVHRELNAIRDTKSPLEAVAEALATQARVLCLDEMQVTDITDAMIMAGLLKGLFERGVVLVTTSNIEPQELYQGGLQRARFLPAIEMIGAHTEVVHFDGQTDYRLRALERAEIYHTPLDQAARQCLEQSFHALSCVEHPHAAEIEINQRPIPVVRWDVGVVWFEFEALCDSPRSKEDYIEIARTFHTVLVGDVPVMNDMRNDPARRWIQLVDEFYDRNVKLIVSAEAAPVGLYTGRRLAFEFERTVSRLQEMQTHEYLARPHLG